MEFLKPTDLKLWAYQTIKQLIITSELKVGQQLQIEVLAQKLGISRTPIREALLILEREGWVYIASRVGFFVKEITINDLEEVFELREVLETYAAGKSAQNLSEEDFERLTEIHENSVEKVRNKNLENFINLEIEFHNIILHKSSNKRLVKIIDGFKELMYRERLLSIKSMENVSLSILEHEKILKSLKQRDSALASNAMHHHVQNVKMRIVKLLKEQKSMSEM